MPVTIGGSGPITGVTSINTTVSDTELGYLDGVTSALQTQINAKAEIGSSSAPFRMAAGALYGGAGNTAVTFPASRFTIAPLTTVTNLDGQTTISYIVAGTLTASGFTFKNSVGSNQTMNYIAIQMTSTSSQG